ncbi:MAG: Na+/H+ antiporter subunit C [Alphaproteobacteria bacterium]|nr:Na+/H+ antiporter subunit C [Alphaproteobacteria bacterium]
MEGAFAIVVGALFAVSVYLLLSGSMIRLLLGIFVLGNATHLLIFVAGRLTRDEPPLIPDGLKVAEAAIANPLPQALILTAIVISFSLFSFLLVLAYRAYQSLETVDTDRMRDAEPEAARQVLRGSDV